MLVRLNLSLIWMIASALATAADLKASCAESKHRAAVTVEFAETQADVDDTHAALDLRAQPHQLDNLEKYAFTQATLVRDLRLRLEGFTDPRTGHACLWPKIDIQLRWEPLRVHLARELSADECFRYHVLEHELAHVAIYQAAVRDAAPKWRDELSSRLQTVRYEGQADRLMAQLQKEMTEYWLPRLEALIDAANVEHDKIDTDEAERALSVCNGATQRVMRAIGAQPSP